MPIDSISVPSAIIGGSSGFKFLESRSAQLDPLGRIATPFGASAPVYRGIDSGLEFLYISRHGDRGYNITASFVNYRANIWALKELGVQRIIAWSGPAAIDPAIEVGEVLVPGDLVDETRRRDYTFFEALGLGFIRQSPTFCPELCGALAAEVSERFGRRRTEDVYVCTEGPRLETVAEIRKFAAYGGTLVGMTLIPEIFLAKELEICYAPICYITNYAEGVRERSFRPGVLFEGLLDDAEKQRVEDSVAAIGEIALAALGKAQGRPRTCKCPSLMERYRRRGDIGQDWRTWIQQTEQNDR
ncbi:MAG: MTAP family purine nucleoside phosphorylase [Armatimonadetes bacterium]|nr:MTAP family purine nucleoside phosphorylase [Armatimonadota bacterium]